MARVLGAPYDPARLRLFESLFVALKQQQYEDRESRVEKGQANRSFAFFEAYFSNYIEGTEFEIADAKKIIESDSPMPTRRDDSHDILGTYKLVSSHAEMTTVPKDGDQLLDLLIRRHKLLLSSRRSKKPGQFKDKNNRAGNTHFVDHTLVQGTLMKGFEYMNSLTHPFAKAVYIMFLISEVHPFLDGNGRIARVMMNAELFKSGHSRILIPTVFRDDYLIALRKLSRQSDARAYIRMLQRAQKFSHTIVGDSIDEMEDRLEASNAFLEHDQGKLKIIPWKDKQV